MRGAGCGPRRDGKKKKKRDRLKKRRKREQVRYASRDFRYTKVRRVCTRCGERSVSARAYSGRGRNDLTARSLPEFTPVFSTRASDGVHEGVCIHITRSPLRPGNTTRDVNVSDSNVSEARGRLAADLARVTPLSKEADRGGERCTTTRCVLSPRAFSPIRECEWHV